jgi:integrase
MIDDEMIDANPCDVHRKHLGPAGDKDPEWRSSALYKRDEIVRLISEPELPPDRRVLYTISFLTGLRLGEVAGMCWRYWQTAELASKLLAAHTATRTRPRPTRRAKSRCTRCSSWSCKAGASVVSKPRSAGPRDPMIR